MLISYYRNKRYNNKRENRVGLVGEIVIAAFNGLI